jgi:hypothetical protein
MKIKGASAKRKPTEEPAIDGLNFDFSKSPTVWKFLGDDSFFRGLLGPVGSGKSYACAAEIIFRAIKQPPSPIDNVRYSRFVIVRNSYPELRTTTIKTWNEIFPENIWGPMRWSPPITHHLRLPTREGIPGLDCEVIFLALDQPKDVRKLLSLELTGAWINEARELPLAVVQGLTHRVGRYPTRANGGAPWRGIWADTNPMDSDHWWYRLSEKETVQGKYKWTFFKQPPGMIEVMHDAPEAIPAAGKHWLINPVAENINNLVNGYYEQQLGGKNLDWIRCYVGGQFVYVQEGKAVWQEYLDSQMVQDKIDYRPDLPLHIGLDFGLTPAAVFGQRLPTGRWNILHEIVSFDMGLERFAQILIGDVNSRYPKAQIFIWGDPAGIARDGIFEVTAFQHLKSLGLNAQPTQSNDFMVRREAGAAPMQRLIDGKPGLQVDSACVRIRKALGGGYHFKRIGVGGGTDRFRDAPNKNEHSHVGDAYGYLMLGGGEFRHLTRGHTAHHPKHQVIAPLDFNVF